MYDEHLGVETLFADVHVAKIRHFPMPYQAENPKSKWSFP